MGTLVTIEVCRATDDAAIDRAFEWFFEIEARCTRFEPRSELMQLCRQVGVPVQVSTILFEAVQFALTVARETGGAFDPTIGRAMQQQGFDREHRSGERVEPAIPLDARATYRDVKMDPRLRTITLLRPMILDLGAVAKGLAIDTAARELQPFVDFSIDAGGDLYLGGRDPQGEPWRVGIQHPHQKDALIDAIVISDQAVCTSGNYERGAHLLDPRTATPVTSVASATVVASSAMIADALATAAFVLGPADGIALLDRMGVAGQIVTSDLRRYETPGLCHAA
jgi:thiamine biosynthesis lipoprotein